MEIRVAHSTGRGWPGISSLSLDHPPHLSAQFFLTCKSTNFFGIGTLAYGRNWTRTPLHSGCCRPCFVFNVRSPSRGFFSSYKKPRLLIPAVSDFKQQRSQPNTLEIPPANGEGSFSSLYVVRLVTSKETASSLSEPNGGIIFALIGQNGKTIMERLMATEHSDASAVDVHSQYHHLRFQKGAVDTMDFYGADVGRLTALWIAPESGTWRLEEAVIDVLPCKNDAREIGVPFKGVDCLSANAISESNLARFRSEEQAAQSCEVGYRYVFKGNEGLLGDNSENSAVELTPTWISHISPTVCDISLGVPFPIDGSLQTRQIGLQEYRSLKAELLAGAAVLVALGTGFMAVTCGEQLGKAFCVGGNGGIIYLFLLQKAVDGLPLAAPTEKAYEKAVIKTAERWTTSLLSIPLVRLSLVSSSVVLLGRLWHGNFVEVLHPQEILACVAGFLTSRFAIFLTVLRSMGSNGGNKNAANEDATN